MSQGTAFDGHNHQDHSVTDDAALTHSAHEQADLEEAYKDKDPHYPGAGTANDPYVIDWDLGDPENPYNWSHKKKWIMTAQVSQLIQDLTHKKLMLNAVTVSFEHIYCLFRQQFLQWGFDLHGKRPQYIGRRRSPGNLVICSRVRAWTFGFCSTQ